MLAEHGRSSQDAPAKKEKVRIRPFWHSDYWVFPKLITIITTLDKHGRVNAGWARDGKIIVLANGWSSASGPPL